MGEAAVMRAFDSLDPKVRELLRHCDFEVDAPAVANLLKKKGFKFAKLYLAEMRTADDAKRFDRVWG
jgi:hypothetical protein